MQVLLKKLDDYSPANSKKIKERETTINAATNLYNNRQKVIEAFKKGIFRYIDGFEKEEESEEESEKESKKESKEEETKNRTEKFIECIEKKQGINYDLFRMHFSVSTPAVLIKKLYEMKNKEKNGDLVNVIKSGLSDLWDEIENMCENEKKKMKNQMKWQILFKTFLSLIDNKKNVD